MLKTLPFTVAKNEAFYDKLSEWIGDVFYDILPEKGFELRDEQIFMAFQLEKAFKEKKTIFAEAGVGTGKTIVYLLYAICYARYTNRPAIISCADETLIEQLVKEEGDIEKISKCLGLDIDVRLAKARDQYVCLNKVDKAVLSEDNENIDRLQEELPSFIHDHSSLTKFEVYGDRKDYAYLTDEEWKKVGWDSLQNCFTCDNRHRCGQTLSRDHYRKAIDLIVCSHDFFMEHVWTKESRKREGQLPLLPEYSAVIFDEGHLLEFSAQKGLTYKISEDMISEVLTSLLANDMREETLELIEDTIYYNELFFKDLHGHSKQIIGSHRYELQSTAKIVEKAQKLQNQIEQVLESLVFEAELHTVDEYSVRVSEEYLEQISYSLSLFSNGQNAVVWLEKDELNSCLVIMPRLVSDILSNEVFAKSMPYIFSSATLSENGSFDYIANSLGIENYSSFSVESPFDYDEVMKIILTPYNKEELQQKNAAVINSIRNNNGSSLVLFPSIEEMKAFRSQLEQEKLDFPVYFEGDEEMSKTVKKFQSNEASVLCSYHMWEGLDIPGKSLNNVIIYGLPFPPNDPVFQAKRQAVNNPFNEVDLPYMILRLRQGIGRLIRTSNDSGQVQIFIDNQLDSEVLQAVKNVLPVTPVEKA
ncbi:MULTISPECIES: ATP-dependent DNA helicase [Bacillus]|uniref:ATP-dependent DNA helicase n=1 Tax=Bacillus TaxID=1386 RepID=UPI0002F684F4|nr:MULTISPECIES: ATP-dependent DNA helicase [Bacillus]